MKKLLFIFPMAIFLAAGCNTGAIPVTQYPNPTPTPTVSSTPTPATPITQQQAINIVVTQKNVDLTKYNIQATFKNGNWYVDTWPKPPTSGHIVINGGNAEYVVDAKTGAIISESLGQ